MEEGDKTRLDKAQYNNNSSNAPFIQQSQPRRVAKRKGKSFSGLDKNPTKQPPDTSRIPWFPPKSKIGTDA
ncbi:MAG: hypothetical protein WA045_10830 [Nitrospira sp.]